MDQIYEISQSESPQCHFSWVPGFLHGRLTGSDAKDRQSLEMDAKLAADFGSGNQFIATGFCGNGFTLGTLAAVMARDRYLGRKNPWFDLFNVGRKKFHGGAWRYLAENLDYPFHLIRDRIKAAEGNSLDDLKRGEGRILKLDGKKVAAYRDSDGKVTLRSPVCTHLGCIVRWNNADKTWDCPCHGSRFYPDGRVFSGPAESPLASNPTA
ncbi:MAG: Rieske 2Fe-2S domain-containing protein [Limisphaerales bacterium]